MKSSKIEAIMLCICLMISFVFIGFTVIPTSAQQTTLYIDPTPVTANVCSTFTVALNIRDVTDLYLWEVKLSFDPTLVECLSATEGPFLSSHGPTIWPKPIIDNTLGTVHIGCALMMPPGVSGSGTLAYIEFHCKGAGECDLTFLYPRTKLYDPNGDTIEHSAVNGHIIQQQEIYWYWKPNYIDYAPSGLPDFDQRQDAWHNLGGQWTWCGPTAVANSFWWLDSEFETGNIPPPTISDHFPLVESYTLGMDDHDPLNVPPFIQDLASLMNTGVNGTEVHDLEKGIEAYLAKKGLGDKFYEITVKQPTIDFVLREFEKCEDVVLLLGFWQYQEPGIWVRTGGHYVTVAGIRWDQYGNYWIAFSDPIQDNAEPPPRGNSAPGQVLPVSPHPPHGIGETLHNDAAFVSHDGYMVMMGSPSPGGLWGFPDYYNYTVFENCQSQNIPVEFLKQSGDYYPFYYTYVEVEYAVVTSPWFEKPPHPDYAPSSVPDIDQKQDLWINQMGQWSWCGPTAVSNSLWWLDSEYEPGRTPPPIISDGFPLVQSYSGMPPAWDDHDPNNVQPFIQHLALLMDTDGRRTGLPHSGTNVIDMQAGISQYLAWTGLNPQGDADGSGVVDHNDELIVIQAMGSSPPSDLRADLNQDNIVDPLDLEIVLTNMSKGGKFYEKTVKMPDFYYIEDEVKKCEDVILLLGFWQEIEPGWWVRVGGHYVTVTGVDSHDGLLSFSDPYLDNAESGGYGRVIPPPPHGHTGPPETIHNNATFVSHDYYFSIGTNSPGGFWGPEGYPADINLENFYEQNVPKEFEQQQGYLPGIPVSVEVEYAVIVSCRTGIAVAGSEDTNVYAFDFVGNLLWTADTGDYPVLSVAVDNEGDSVAAGSGNRVNAGVLSLYDGIGTLQWSKALVIMDSYDGGWAGTESKSVDVKHNYYNELDIVAAAHSGGLNLYDQLGNLIWAYSDGSPETIVRISQDGNYLVCTSATGPGVQKGVHYFSHLRDGIPGWGPADGTPLWTAYKLDTDGFFWVAISGSGDYVAVSGWWIKPNAYVELLNRTGGQVWIHTLARGGYVRVDMPCDGKSVVTVNDDGTNTVGCQLNYYGVAGGINPTGWDSGDNVPDWTYDPALSPFDDFYSVAISGNGDIIATGPATANSIYVLDKGGTLLQTIGDGVMQSVDLTFQGKYGVEGDNNGVIWFFDKDLGLKWIYQTYGMIHSVAISKIYPCMFPYPNHDVAVTNVTPKTPGKTQAYQELDFKVAVTVQNQGNFTETFSVTLCANTTVLGCWLYTLPVGVTNQTTFTWSVPSSFPKGNYALSATVSIVTDEIDITDNTFIDGVIKVTMPVDVNDDKLCDLLDLVRIAGRFGTMIGDPDYVPNYDVNCDGLIDLLDLVKCAIYFGNVDP